MAFFNRPVSMFLAFSIFFTTTVPQNLQAHALTTHSMEMSAEKKISDLFNKFRYDMTVEWDQQDPYFREYAQKELENSLMALKAEGVSDLEILNFMQNNILDAKAKKEYSRLLLAMQTQKLSEGEAAQKAMKFMEKNYQQGTNFAGGGSRSYKWVAIVVGVVIVGVVTYLVFKHSKKKTKTSSEASNSGESTLVDDSTESETMVDSEASTVGSTIGGEVSTEAEAEAEVEAEASAEGSTGEIDWCYYHGGQWCETA